MEIKVSPEAMVTLDRVLRAKQSFKKYWGLPRFVTMHPEDYDHLMQEVGCKDWRLFKVYPPICGLDILLDEEFPRAQVVIT